ncbi:MAG: exodeoxyribonuclease VII large subunit [Cryomorphaceae bacterium]|nr:exodeoxyribonuclease VII large subunit [Cryomorphaceae bacterium]
MSERQIFTLKQITASVGKAIEKATGGRGFWIKAEIAQMKTANSGHAYLELVELQNQVKIASMQAIIWKNEFLLIQKKLGSDFSNVLRNGSEVVIFANIEFHQVYGIKLRITDIDLSFTLGALEKRKQETLNRLRKEGLLEKNRKIPQPRVIQHIALITSPGSAANEDFSQHLMQNERGYLFYIDLYPAPVQGEQAAARITETLLTLPTEKYDAIAILRGGGSKLDLDPFNDYNLCKAVANSSIPVLTGIGHETDLSIIDVVAGSPHKTPTAIADFLIDKALQFEHQMAVMFVQIARKSAECLKINDLRLSQFQSILAKYPKSYCQRQRGDLHNLSTRLIRTAAESVREKKSQLSHSQLQFVGFIKHRVEITEPRRIQQFSEKFFERIQHQLTLRIRQISQLQSAVQLVHPDKTLARGFSVSRQNGKALRTTSDIDPDELLHTTLHQATIISKILSIQDKKTP